MFDFKKVAMFAVAGLGLVGVANAQTPTATCTTLSTATTPIVAVEGTTEALGAITLTCNTVAPNAVNAATVVLNANVPLTNTTTTATSGILDVVVTANATNNTGATIIANGVTVLAAATGTIPASSVSESGASLTAVFSLNGLQLNSITASGTRVNASSVPSSSTVTVTATGVAGGAILTTGVNTLTAAYVLTSVVPSTLVSGADVSLCTATITSTPTITTLTVQENFAAAFKTKTEQAVVGSNAAARGTRLAITFNNLNANVNYYVPFTITNGTVTAVASLTATGAVLASGVSVGTPAVTGQVLLTPTGSSATIYYEITADSLAAIDSFSIPLKQNIPSVSNVTTVLTPSITAQVSLAGGTSGYPQYVTATPATTTAPAVVATNGLVTACSTTLLFPYVVNSGGYDTGIAIANASTGTGLAAVTPTAGSCSVAFYGDNGTATAPVAYSTGTIATGKVAVLVVSDKAAGLAGYAVATCNFQGAHGYAFVTDGFGGGGRGLAADYLAVVLSTAGAATPNVASN